MAEYIEREAAKLRIFEYGVRHRNNSSISSACENLERQMNSIPAADVRPVVRAQIIDMRYVEEDGEWKCSRCGWQYTLCVCGKDVTSKIHFCPNCGADMRPTSMSGANGEES